MTAGLQVWNQFGVLRADISHRFLRFVGDPVYVNAGEIGSVYNEGLLTGTPGCIDRLFLNNVATTFPGDGMRPVAISFGGGFMHYTVPAAGGTHILQMVVY